MGRDTVCIYQVAWMDGWWLSVSCRQAHWSGSGRENEPERERSKEKESAGLKAWVLLFSESAAATLEAVLHGTSVFHYRSYWAWRRSHGVRCVMNHRIKREELFHSLSDTCTQSDTQSQSRAQLTSVTERYEVLLGIKLFFGLWKHHRHVNLPSTFNPLQSIKQTFTQKY